MKSIIRGSDVNEGNIVEWINCDDHDLGFDHLSDENNHRASIRHILEESEEEEDSGRGHKENVC